MKRLSAFMLETGLALLALCAPLSAAETPPALVFVSTALTDGYYPMISVDGSGNTYVTYTGYGDPAPLWASKISPKGELIWKTGLPAESEWVARIKTDAGGNSYLAVGSYAAGNFLLKYGADGVLIKKQSIPVFGSGNIDVEDLAYDPLRGRIYATESFYNPGTDTVGIVVLVYNTDLELLGQKEINYASFDSYPALLAVDPQGNVYVNGMIRHNDPDALSAGFFEVKYEPELASLVFNKETLDDRDGWFWATAADPQGNTYTVGALVDFTACLMKRDAEGNVAYIKTSLNPYNPYTDVAVDKGGDPYVPGLDAAAIKYSPDGDAVWSLPAPLSPLVTWAIALDGEGGLYVAGHTWDVNYTYRPVAMKYSASTTTCVEVAGVPDWKQFNDGTNDWYDDEYDHSGSSMSALGCFMTAAAEVVKKDGFDTDPGRLNEMMKTVAGGFDGSDLNPFALVDMVTDHGITVSYDKIMGDNIEKMAALEDGLNSGNPVILELYSASTVNGSHFVVAVKKCGNTIYINDPGHATFRVATLAQYFNLIGNGNPREIKSVRVITKG